MKIILPIQAHACPYPLGVDSCLRHPWRAFHRDHRHRYVHGLDQTANVKRRPTLRTALLRQSREAALNAVQTFNNPLTTLKTETFIVLMVIAWPYLLHAYYRQKGVEYRYHTKGPRRRRFDRTGSGDSKYWDLERCLRDQNCPLDIPTKENLRFLIGLRNEIEHHRSAGVDDQFSGRYLACCLNYEKFICRLFGSKHSLGSVAAFTLQFRDLESAPTLRDAVHPLPARWQEPRQRIGRLCGRNVVLV